MELNFNSVEMSCKPNTELSSIGYAEVRLTFNSVETIANLNAFAAFQVDSAHARKTKYSWPSLAHSHFSFGLH